MKLEKKSDVICFLLQKCLKYDIGKQLIDLSTFSAVFKCSETLEKMFSPRTMDTLAVVVRWCMFLLLGLGWQVQSQTVPQTSVVDNSYNFYFEQPCCTGTVPKSKYHTRHRRGKFFVFIFLTFDFKYYTQIIEIRNPLRKKQQKNNCY